MPEQHTHSEYAKRKFAQGRTAGLEEGVQIVRDLVCEWLNVKGDFANVSIQDMLHLTQDAEGQWVRK
jgi:hypothetical protein